MEKRLLQLCSADKESFSIQEFHSLILDESICDVDVSDEHGMTPLMHCAYHGYLDPCTKLLARGADVNNSKQKDGYTALMLAAVAGKGEVVRLLLRSGANPNAVNNLGKSASKMSAFVGQHECAQIILNYFSLHELDEFTKVDKHLKRPHLFPSLATPLHSLLVTTHLHPVMVIQEMAPALVSSYSEVTSVLMTLSLRLINEQREGLALKLHYLSYLIELAHNHGTDAVITKLLTFDKDGKAVEMDLLLRQCLRQFSHPHLALLKQMITSLAKTPAGDQPNAYTLFISVILGDKEAGAIAEACFTCGRLGQDPLKKCSRCKRVWYCTVQCQQLAWTKGNHKKLCKLWTTPTK